MASVLLVGPDSALLEGIAQSLAGAGHRARFAESLGDAIESCIEEPPLVAVLQRELVTRSVGIPRMLLAPGGTLVLYRGHDDSQPSLPASLLRAAIADLELPLERQRLVALVQQIEDRARRAGRMERRTPPESHRAL